MLLITIYVKLQPTIIKRENMENSIATHKHLTPRPILPSNIDEAWRVAKAIALSGMLPKSYGHGTPEEMTAKAFTAMQLGAEVGLTPMQAIQSIAVVNGMPTIWGDAMKAVCIAQKDFEYMHETYEGVLPNDDYTAVCKVKRAGHDEITERFSVADAKTASLWKKQGPWTTHPKRMLKYKARSFALRDTFPDVLKGLKTTEEVRDYTDVTPSSNTPKPKERRQSNDINEILLEQENNKPVADSQSNEKSEGVGSGENSASDAAKLSLKARAEAIKIKINNAATGELLQLLGIEIQPEIAILPQDISDELSDCFFDKLNELKNKD